LTVYIGAMIFVMLGVGIIFNSNYNFLDDVATIPIIIFWIIITIIFIYLGKKLVLKANIWNYSKFTDLEKENQLKKKQNILAIQD